MRGLMAAVMVLMLAGCAVQPPQMTRDEYLQVTQRTYEGKTPDDIYRAAEKLFVLSDGQDFKFFHTEDSMVASRPWSVYLVLAASMGVDTWTIRAREVDSGTKVSAALNTSMGSILPIPTTSGDMTAGGMPSMAGNVPGTAIYDIFWSRMDYLLGKTDKWMTCKEADARVKSKVKWGTNEALCNSFNVKDAAPEDLAKVAS